MGARAIASAAISFGMVTIPVKLYTTAESASQVRFNQLEKATGARVKQQYISSKTGEIVPREEGIGELKDGQIVHAVVAQMETNEAYRMAAASIGVSIPENRDRFGYLSEHHSFGEDEKVAGDFAEDLAAQMLATILGIEFDPETAYDERQEVYRMSGQIVESTQVTQTALGQPGVWTTVIAAAVLLP